MGRPPCCDKSNVKRGLWTPEEDAKILAHVANHGTGNWTLAPKKAGLNRCAKSCRLRWTNYLRPDLKHDNFTPQEEEIIINFHKVVGSRWSLIAKRLPGRTDNDVKNYWNTKLKKKLSNMGIDPVTHKPISQLLSDYGNISGVTMNATSYFGDGNIKNTLFSPPETSSVQETSSITNYIPVWDFMPHFFSTETASSSCSSPSSGTITRLSSCQQSESEISPPSPITWTEFLVDESTFSVDHPRQLQNKSKIMLLPTNSNLAENKTSGCNIISDNDPGFGVYSSKDNKGNQVKQHANVDSSSASTFVDDILSKDREMSSQLFELQDLSFD